MPRPPSTYVIQNAAGLFYSVCDIVGSKDSIELDGTGNKVVHSRHVLKPRFDSSTSDNASKFGTEQDAEDMMAHPDLADPKAFKDCVAVATDDL